MSRLNTNQRSGSLPNSCPFVTFVAFLCLLVLASLAPGAGAEEPKPKPDDPKPGGSPPTYRSVTSKDKGPKRDPVKFAARKFDGMPPRASFRSFMSGCYALDNVWIYAAGDEQALYDERVTYLYPEFYEPTWGEVFDHVARQMRCTWSWNPENRQFKFERLPAGAQPGFGVELADGWRREDRGLYVWHAPRDAEFGLDIYDFGHYTPPAPPAGVDRAAHEKDFAKRVREHVATHMLRGWPTPPVAADMTPVKLAADDAALHLATATPRPGAAWRQWAVLVDGHAYLIVNAMPKTSEPDLLPAVERMVATFKAERPTTTRPAAPAAKTPK